MIGYVTLGTNNFGRAETFYETLAGELGHKRAMEFPGFILWGNPAAGGCFALVNPHNQEPASAGNGTMAAFAAKDRAQVDKIYQMVLDMGGTDEGPPGERAPGFYAAYFRDLDGNKLNAFAMGPA